MNIVYSKLIKKFKLISALLTLLTCGAFAEEVCYTETKYDLLMCGYYSGGGGYIYKNYYDQPSRIPEVMIITSGGNDYFYQGCGTVNEVYEDICNYRPTANFTDTQEPDWPGGTNRVTIFSTSTDPDGSISSYLWKVNGVTQSTTNSSLVLYNGNPNGQTKTIYLKVTDDEGLSNTIQKAVFLEPPCESSCGPLH
jgi:hypothetical protein